MPAKQTNNDILTQLQIDVATTKASVGTIDSKVENLDQRVQDGFASLKGYVPVDIYQLNMDAQKLVNINHDARLSKVEAFIESNSGGIKFSNDIVKNILKTVAAAAAAFMVIAAAYTLLKHGGM